ncbi:ribosomal protein L7/L12 [Rivularia sp. PCC 7116]|uniref:50S ribosomal protein L7/L12 n=1 Tax=Rivularia sp. PCC 7116 TaxID=373994 RepID=UPI00029F38E6|nr:50S ribosomal protein L7/L12 [Rivularia sp. PCC 7116]AFY58751.1 ribosomal protein L7/L12 [Rivularia sp. PCC 7116]
MSVQVLEIVEQLKSLSLVETTELVKQIEDTFNIDASRYQIKVPVVTDQITDEKEVESQQTEFDVVLEEVPSNKKIAILKLIRGITGLGLKEAKDFVDSVPQTVKTGIAIAEAEDIKQQLEAVEAKVSLK